MPASSQESLLRWDFPIYFMKARRPDTGGDKHSRLQVLIVSGSWALQLWPVSLLEMQAKIQFGSKSKGLPNWKNVIITHPCQPLRGNQANDLLNFHHGWYSGRGEFLRKWRDWLSTWLHIATTWGRCKKIGVSGPQASSQSCGAYLTLVQLTCEMFGGHTAG